MLSVSSYVKALMGFQLASAALTSKAIAKCVRGPQGVFQRGKGRGGREGQEGWAPRVPVGTALLLIERPPSNSRYISLYIMTDITHYDHVI